MIATLVKIERKPSRYGGHFFYAFFKEVKTGDSYYTCLYPKMRNFSRWSKVLREGVTLKDLRLVKGNKRLIDADSRFKTLTDK